MPIEREALLELARRFTSGMTSIRGRRVQRLVTREFAGFDRVLPVWTAGGQAAVLGLGNDAAALCATDGRGPAAAVVRWALKGGTVRASRFDLLKDSLPALGEPQPADADRLVGWRLALDDLPRAAAAHARRAHAALGRLGRHRPGGQSPTGGSRHAR